MQATFLDAPTAIEPRGGRASVRPEVEPLPDHFFTASGILRYANVTSDKILTRAYTNREKLALALLRMNDPYGRGAFVTDAEFALACGIETGGKDKGRGQVARVIRGLVAKGAIGIVPVSPHVHISGRMFHLPPDPTRAEPFPRAFLPSEVEASPRDMSAKPPRRRSQGALTPAPSPLGAGAKAPPIKSIRDQEDKETTTTGSTPLNSDEQTNRLLSSPSRVSESEEAQADPGEPEPRARPVVTSRCLDRPVDDPEPPPPLRLVRVPDPAAAAFDQAMLRIKAQAGQVPTAQPVPDRPVSPSPARPKRPKADPDSPHRQRLNDWIDAHDGDLIWRAETRRLVKDTLKILATSRPAEGMAMDPYEQVRLALEAAAEADRDGKVDTSIGVYAKGTIRKRIKDGEYLPLVDPALKLDAEAAKRAAEVEAKRLVKLEADAVEAKRLEAEAAKRARWESLPEAERERIKAIVAAEHPEIRPSWKVLLEAHWFAAMDRPTVEPPPPIEIPLEIPPQAPPPEPSPAPAPITLARPGRTRRLLSEPVAWVEPSPQAESDFEAKRRAVLARLGVVRTPKPIPIPPPDPDPEPDPGESESDPVPELYDWI